MRKTQKRALGFFGLSLIAVMTIFAAFWSDFDAGAVSSVTDTIQVQVVGSKPDVKPDKPDVGPTEPTDDTTSKDTSTTGTTTTIASIEANSSLSYAIVTEGKQEISFSYSSVGEVTIIIYHTDEYGETTETIYETFNANYTPGTYKKTIDFSAEKFGYGDYVVRIIGVGADGVPDGAIIAFSYYPLNANVTKNSLTGATKLNIRYDKDFVARIKVNIYDEYGELIAPPSPLYESDLDGSGKISMELMLSDYELGSGKYRLEFIAYDMYGLVLYEPLSLWMNYSTVEVPNTNQTTSFNYDYLIIGLIMFLALSILFILFASRKRKEIK